MNNKEKYRNLCKKESSIPIFSRDWWLDAVCNDTEYWDVAIVEKGDEIVASMPYFIKHKYGFTLCTQPKLTQTLGPWLRPSKAKYAKMLSQQKNLMQALIDQLPSYDYFIQSWNYKNTNCLPFFWRGFEVMTRYTYMLPDLSDEKKIWSGVQANIRTDIRKAENRYNIKIRDDLDIDTFLSLNKLTFTRQDKKVPYTDKYVHTLDQACDKHHCRKILIAEDSKGRHHAGVYIIWDENSAYYIMGGGDSDLRNSGATSLCMWHAILHASRVTKQFDFEGSMLEPVERFFRAFGAFQTPYLNITKTPSRLLRLREAINLLIK